MADKVVVTRFVPSFKRIKEPPSLYSLSFPPTISIVLLSTTSFTKKIFLLKYEFLGTIPVNKIESPAKSP